MGGLSNYGAKKMGKMYMVVKISKKMYVEGGVKM